MNKKHIIGLVLLILVFFGLYFVSSSNKPILEQNQDVRNIQNIQRDISEARLSNPSYESFTGVITNIQDNSLSVSDSSGKGYVSSLTSTTKYIKIPIPALIIENPDINKETPANLDQVSVGNNVSVLLAPFTNDVDTLYIYSNNIQDFQ